MRKTSFYSYFYKEQDGDFVDFKCSFPGVLDLFPYFPDVGLISELSYENYERKTCFAKLIFLPFETLRIKQENNPLIFSYSNEGLSFEREHIRLIRKIVESSDNEHALVLCRNNNGVYCFIGMIKESLIDKLLSEYYYISITGYSHWSARCKNFNLFDFKNGHFEDYNKNQKDFTVQMKDVLDCFDKCSYGTDLKLLKNVLKTIKRQDHGTSFVVFKDSNKAQEQAKRMCDAQRGFTFEKPLNYSEFVKCIPQFIKIDGGILLDSNLTCYAYGCIYDGLLSPEFKGSLANGSRFNSTTLYTHNLNNEKTHGKSVGKGDQLGRVCLGVVFSDDGGVKIAKVK